MKRNLVCNSATAFSLAVILIMGIQATVVRAETKAIRISALLPFSGSYGQWGIATFRAHELMAEKINREGGIKVGNDIYQIQLIKADTKSNFDIALSQANRLVFKEKIKFILGPIMSGSTLAVLPVTEANKVIVMSNSFSPKVLGPDKKYSFRLFASGDERVEAIFGYLNNYRPDVSTIAVVGPNDETGWGTSKGAIEKAKRYGYEVVFEDYFQHGTTDFFPLLTRMMSKNPDVMLPHSFPPPAMALLLQQKHQLGYKGTILTPSFSNHQFLISKAGVSAVEGFIFQSPDMTGPKAKPGMIELYEKYEEKYGEELNVTATASYSFLWVLKLAMEKAGSLDTTVIANTLERLEGNHPFGHFSMGGLKTYGAKHQMIEPVFMSEIRNGKLVGLESVTPPVP